MTSILILHIFSDPADADFSAAILVKLAVNVEKTPSGFLKPKVSRSQNKCQNSIWYEKPRAHRPDPGLHRNRLRAGRWVA